MRQIGGTRQQRNDGGSLWIHPNKKDTFRSRMIKQVEERFINIPSFGQPGLTLQLIDLTWGMIQDASSKSKSARLSGTTRSESSLARKGKVAAKHGHYNPKNR